MHRLALADGIWRCPSRPSDRIRQRARLVSSLESHRIGFAAVGIKRFVWTEHAEMRLHQRHLDVADVEQAIKERLPSGRPMTVAPNGL